MNTKRNGKEYRFPNSVVALVELLKTIGNCILRELASSGVVIDSVLTLLCKGGYIYIKSTLVFVIAVLLEGLFKHLQTFIRHALPISTAVNL